MPDGMDAEQVRMGGMAERWDVESDDGGSIAV